MKKILTNCPKTKREDCKGCKSCNRCRLRKIKKFWQSYCTTIVLTVIIFIMCLQLSMVIIVNYDRKETEKRNQAIKEELENYKVPEETTKKNVQLLLKKVEPIVIVKAQPVNVKKVEEIQPVTVAKISPYEAGENYYYWVSGEDKVNLEKVVFKEAAVEPFEGKVAVAAVVLNRWVSGDQLFDTSSVTAVIVQKYQFASIANVTQKDLDAVPDCAKAVELALKGWDPTRVAFENGAKFFYQPDITYGNEFDRRQGIEVYKIGNHLFHNDFAY